MIHADKTTNSMETNPLKRVKLYTPQNLCHTSFTKDNIHLPELTPDPAPIGVHLILS